MEGNGVLTTGPDRSGEGWEEVWRGGGEVGCRVVKLWIRCCGEEGEIDCVDVLVCICMLGWAEDRIVETVG